MRISQFAVVVDAAAVASHIVVSCGAVSPVSPDGNPKWLIVRSAYFRNLLRDERNTKKLLDNFSVST